MQQRRTSNSNSIDNHTNRLLTVASIIRTRHQFATQATAIRPILHYIPQIIPFTARTIPQFHITIHKPGREHGNPPITTIHHKILSLTKNKDDNHTHGKTGKKKQYVTYVPRSTVTHQKKLRTKQDGNQSNSKNHKKHQNNTSKKTSQTITAHKRTTSQQTHRLARHHNKHQHPASQQAQKPYQSSSLTE